MRALVTGSSGFVGSHLVDLLMEAGHEVRCLVRRTSNLKWLDGKKVELSYGSILDSGSLVGALRGVERVFHVAGITRARNAIDFQRVNAEGTRNLIKACLDRGDRIDRFVYCSSLAAGGPSPDGSPVDEKTPPEPFGTYGRTKYDGEVALAERCEDLSSCVVRPPAIYGPRDVAMLPLFRAVLRGFVPAIGRGERLYSFVHVKDVARVLLLASEKGTPGGVYYVTDGAIHTWREIGRLAAEALSRKARVVTVPAWILWGLAFGCEAIQALGGPPGAFDREKVRRILPRFWVCDDTRAREELGYETEYPLERGLPETAEWYRKEGWI